MPSCYAALGNRNGFNLKILKNYFQSIEKSKKKLLDHKVIYGNSEVFAVKGGEGAVKKDGKNSVILNFGPYRNNIIVLHPKIFHCV